ncbi:MAG: sodium-translocating pyrophosphatase [Myxococcales bacterium]|nr:sodium-translocating pyrophosphatase [Myxococcales bacterium]MCB9519979.1 sodium-translocating pyrophosphatase [Myxococcales bacterium]MCB9533110.1 sodium-translocating pyrophosphatase [Myxococcales bacterium]
MESLVYTVPVAGVLALGFAFWKSTWINAQDGGDATMQKIAGLIRAGAMAFLAREYRVLAIFAVVVAIALAASSSVAGSSPLVALSFVVGAAASALSGYFGMRVATKANHRTTAAARKGLPEALAVAFAGGSVMGMSVVGLGLVGLGSLFILYTKVLLPGDEHLKQVLDVLAGFSMGASSIALFARVGGGIYTKAADVGADLVGKVEAGLPEDDPRNPAVIADNVGDNVGDVAGMGADLFESYVGAIIGTMVLGYGFHASVEAHGGSAMDPILLPLVLAAAGIVASIAGTFVVRTKEGGNPQLALDTGAFGAAGVMAIASYFIIQQFWPAGGVLIHDINAGIDKDVSTFDVFLANVIGLATGVAVGVITAYYCSMGKKPVNSIVEQSKTGTATNIIAGLSVGMESTAVPMLLIAAGVVGANYFAGLYGVALAALGMLSTTGIQLAVDAYGPIADNAGGIAEMSHQPKEVRERTDTLDAVGNTTAAIGKGFAIASAAMTALALFAAFMQQANITTIDVSNPKVTAAFFIGGMLPFLFSSMAMNAVGRSAMDMIEEVRRQFREIPGLLEGTADPDPARCVDISTAAAIREMIKPGLMAVIVPVVVGVTMGPNALGGLLAGVTLSGVLLAIFMSNAGGAWDNAKKSFEGGGFTMADGTVHKKGSETHKAAVVGDTVGDPFKDTAGPSLNILVKLMSVVALVIAPMIAVDAGEPAPAPEHAAVVAPDNADAPVTVPADAHAELDR